MVWHTTETSAVPGYGGGLVAPTFSAHVAEHRWIQHAPIGKVVGTLKGWASSGGPTNHANVVAQVEIISYSSRAIADQHPSRLWVGDFDDEDLAFLAELPAWLLTEGWLDAPLAWSPGWTGTSQIREMSWAEWLYGRDDWNLTGHDQNPDSSNHWDPGALDRVRLVELAGGAQPKEDDLFCKRGDRGDVVTYRQLQLQRIDSTLLPTYGADGDYGAETVAAVKAVLGGNGEKIGPEEAVALEAKLGNDGTVTLPTGGTFEVASIEWEAN